jgi:hypothetical protein
MNKLRDTLTKLQVVKYRTVRVEQSVKQLTVDQCGCSLFAVNIRTFKQRPNSGRHDIHYNVENKHATAAQFTDIQATVFFVHTDCERFLKLTLG